MKKLLLVIIGLTLLASVAWGQHQGGTISGAVLGQHDGVTVPLRYANVQAFQSDNNWPTGMAMTDSLGQYTIHVPYGRYVVRAQAREFASLWYNNVPERSQATVVAVAEGNNPTGIDFLLNPPEPPPPPPGTGTISGVVIGHLDSSDVPLGMAHVMVLPPNSDHPVAGAMTDPTGHYSIRVPAGDYQVRAEAMRFVGLWYNNVPERPQATILTVADSAAITGIDFLLPLQPPPPPPPGQGIISGTIVGQHDSATVPLPASVFAFHPDGDHPVAMTMTDRSGHYTLRVNFGNYQIRAEAMHFMPLWYNNVPERAQATIVTVDSAINPTGIDFVLGEQGPPPPPPPPSSGIAGIVTDAGANQPLVGAMVIAIDVNNHWMHFGARTDSTGAYLIGTRPGEYIVQAMVRGYNQAEYPTHVTVAESTIVRGINFALTAINFGSIAGTVTDTAGVMTPGAFIEARKLGMPYTLHAVTDSTGAYIVHNVLAGAYRIRAFKRGFAPGVYPDSVVVAEGQAVTGINIVLATIPPPFQGTIAGTIADDSTGAPISHAVVVAIGGERHRMFRYTFTNDDGTYTLDGLAQVPYKVFAGARGYVGEFYDNVRNFADATPVTPNATGINFALDATVPGYRAFGGYVNGPDGITLEGAVVTASINGVIAGATVTDLDGYYSFEGVEPGVYNVSAASIIGNGELDRPVDAAFNDVPNADIQLEATSVGDDSAPIPTASSLAQNYPNPFNAQTMISFNLATAGRVELDVYNMIGQKIATLVNGDYNPGSYSVVWNAGNVSSGIYYYRLKTANQTQTMKMTLLK